MKKFEIDYVKRQACPVCSFPADGATSVGEMQTENYLFKKYYIPSHAPSERTSVLYCCGCGVYYKDYVPEPVSLSRLFESSIGNVWNKSYDYNNEIQIAKALFPGIMPDVLDVGASNGELLRRFSPFCSRLSALDVVKNPECERYVTGEYITGWLEDESLRWSWQPYDLVTLFDVVEHLYHADKSFANLKKLVKQGGYVLVETGDAESFLPRRYGQNNWWYINRIEHHLAFTRASIEHIAAKFGFSVAFFQRKRHKYIDTLSASRIAAMLAMSFAYRTYPSGYLKLMRRVFRKPIVQPRNVIENDHLLIALKRS